MDSETRALTIDQLRTVTSDGGEDMSWVYPMLRVVMEGASRKEAKALLWYLSYWIGHVEEVLALVCSSEHDLPRDYLERMYREALFFVEGIEEAEASVGPQCELLPLRKLSDEEAPSHDN